jgi:broad specificity phosphatase PhoE
MFTKYKDCSYTQKDVDREVYSLKVEDAPTPKRFRLKVRMPKDVVFIRHAQSCGNVASIFEFTKKFHQDSYLSSDGFQQALKAGRRMRKMFGRVKTIFCSSLPRAMLTAKLLGVGLGSQEVVRVGGVKEQRNIFDREKLPSYNNVSRRHSNQHAEFLNRHVLGPRIKPFIVCEGRGLKHFMKKVLPVLPQFSLVVSHKFTIQKLSRKAHHRRHQIGNLDWIRLRFE